MKLNFKNYTYSLDPKIIEQFKEIVKRDSKYANDSHFVRIAIENLINEETQKQAENK